MLRVIDIELLRCTPFQELIDMYHPSATVVRIVYGLPWLMLFELKRPDPERVQLEWIFGDHTVSETVVKDRVKSDISLVATSELNVLYIVDTLYPFCKDIITTYNKDWIPTFVWKQEENQKHQNDVVYRDCFQTETGPEPEPETNTVAEQFHDL